MKHSPMLGSSYIYIHDSFMRAQVAVYYNQHKLSIISTCATELNVAEILFQVCLDMSFVSFEPVFLAHTL